MGSFVAALSTVLCTFALLVSTGEGRLVDGVMGDLVRFSHVGLAILGLTIFSLASAVSLLYLVVFDRLKRKKTTFLQAPMPALGKPSIPSAIVLFSGDFRFTRSPFCWGQQRRCEVKRLGFNSGISSPLFHG